MGSKSEPQTPPADAMLVVPQSVKKEPVTPKAPKDSEAAKAPEQRQKFKRKPASNESITAAASKKKTKTGTAEAEQAQDAANVEQAPAAAGEVQQGGGTSAASSAASSAPAAPEAASSSTEANMAPAQGEDLTGKLLLRLKPGDKPPEQPSTKERYLASSIVIPGIALKKAKQAMSQQPGSANTLVAILGEGECTCYRVTKPSVEKLVMGDIQKYGSQFWKKVSDHLKKKSAAVVILPFNSIFTIQNATHLTFS